MKRLWVLMLTGMVVVTSLFAGCRGCASGKEVRREADPVPAQSAVTSFALTEGDVRCLDPAACGDPDVRMVFDLAKDFVRPVDWDSEPDVWRENHDIEMNLPKDCVDYEKILRLSRTRQKLFYILRKLSHDDPRWKDEGWFKKRSYYWLLFNRNAGRLQALFESKRDMVVRAVGLDPVSAADWGLFARELLSYHQKVVSTPGWEAKLRDLAASNKNLVLGDHFHDAGFPRNKNVSYHNGNIFGGNYIIGYDNGLEGWLYSFWLRRHQEGTMELVKEALEWVSARLPFKEALSAEALTTQATGPAQGGFDDPAAGREIGPNEQVILCAIRGETVTLRSKPEWCAR